jgi:hypothetical protein
MITLKTLPLATREEVKAQIEAHLLAQGEQCTAGASCRYRLVRLDGSVLKCAAGCLIGDDEYDEGFEGCTWGMLVSEYNLPTSHNDLIQAYQRVHDSVDPSQWPYEFSWIK